MFVAEGCCGDCVSVGGVCGDGGLAVAVLVIIIVILLLVVVVVIVVVAECERPLRSPILQRVFSYEAEITKLCQLSKWPRVTNSALRLC